MGAGLGMTNNVYGASLFFCYTKMLFHFMSAYIGFLEAVTETAITCFALII
jgi:hypothetical protein